MKAKSLDVSDLANSLNDDATVITEISTFTHW